MSKITIFISYAKEDEKWLNRFKPHLLSLEKDYPVEIWYDKKIKPGEDWRESIIRSLESSLVGICLVSPYFLCSDFIRNKELPVLVKGVRSEEKLLLPIILSPCRFLETKEISVYQGVNYADKPLCELSSNEQEKIFYNASTVVEQFIKIHLDKKKMKGKFIPRYNVVIVGKTGVGKTSLINYLYGKKVRETGVGKGFTEPGFHPIEHHIKDLPVMIFDSWGIEAGKSKEWKEFLQLELSKRSVDKSVEEWFHTVFYCVQVGGARIEDFEINLIKEFLNKKYSVIILLTKADQGSKNDIDILKNIMLEEFKIEIPIIPICSIDGVRSDNTKFEKSGKEEVEKYVYNEFWNSITLRLPGRCERVIHEWIDNWVKDVRKRAIELLYKKDKYKAYSYIEKATNSLENTLFGRHSIIIQLIDAEIRKTFEMYGLFLKMITYSPKSLNKFANLDIDIDIPEPEEYGLKDVLDEILKLKRLDIGFTYYKKKIKKVLNLMDPESEKWKGEIKRDVKYIGYNVKSSLEDIQDKVRVLLLDSIKKGKCDITAG